MPTSADLDVEFRRAVQRHQHRGVAQAVSAVVLLGIAVGTARRGGDLPVVLLLIGFALVPPTLLFHTCDTRMRAPAQLDLAADGVGVGVGILSRQRIAAALTLVAAVATLAFVPAVINRGSMLSAPVAGALTMLVVSSISSMLTAARFLRMPRHLLLLRPEGVVCTGWAQSRDVLSWDGLELLPYLVKSRRQPRWRLLCELRSPGIGARAVATIFLSLPLWELVTVLGHFRDQPASRQLLGTPGGLRVVEQLRTYPTVSPAWSPAWFRPPPIAVDTDRCPPLPRSDARP